MKLKKLENSIQLMQAQLSFIRTKQKEQQKINKKIINYSKKACNIPGSGEKKTNLSLPKQNTSSFPYFEIFDRFG